MGGGRQSAENREEAGLLRLTRLRNVFWRDFAFLVLGGIALKVINYVESHASDADLRGGSSEENSAGIVDAGFVITAPLHCFLSARRDWNDALALLNSILLVAPNAYLAKVTLWDGDYTLSFRLLAAQLFRSFCGWFTYLPPDEAFLMSYYDFPEILECMSRDCSSSHSLDASGGEEEEVLPFVSFFSGHVATVVMAANHMYLAGHVRWAVVMHAMNALQIVRLLATRGHYSIDIIIGWCVAVYVTNPAERLGRYYSRGVTLQQLVVPGNARDAFERFTGLYDVKLGGGGGKGARGGVGGEWSPISSRGGSGVGGDGDESGNGDDGGRYCYFYEDDGGPVTSDTAARILAETATDFAARNIADLRSELSGLGLRMHDVVELRRAEMLRLLDLAELRMAELRAEARWFVGSGEDRESWRKLERMSRKEVLQLIMERAKRVADRTARIAASMAPDFAMRSLAEMRAELVEMAGLRMRQVQEIIQELRRKDILRLLALAQLQLEELRAEARFLGVKITDGMGRGEILVNIMMQMRDFVLERLSTKSESGDFGDDNDEKDDTTLSGDQQSTATAMEPAKVPVLEENKGVGASTKD